MPGKIRKRRHKRGPVPLGRRLSHRHPDAGAQDIIPTQPENPVPVRRLFKNRQKITPAKYMTAQSRRSPGKEYL